MAGATRPVQGGAYSAPRSEPGGQNTPRAGRVVASYGSYTVAIGLFAQQVNQGDIFDDAADDTAIVTASGSGVEDYQVADSGSGTATASGSGTESWSGPVVYTDAASGTLTASGTGVEKRVYADDATYYDNVLDLDNPVSHWKLGSPTTAVDRKGVRNLPAANSPVASASALVANNGTNNSNSFVRASADFFGIPLASNQGVPYDALTWSVEAWFSAASNPGTTISTLGRDDHQTIRLVSGTGIQLRWRDAADTPRQVPNSPMTAVIGTTYHVVGVFDGTDAILYVNGIENSRLATTSRSVTNAVPSIGAQNYGTATAFNGTIDEVAWYSGALTAARVLAHYQAGTTPTGGAAPGSGTATATGTGAESYVYTDTATGTATATGSGVESYASADSGSVATVVSGSASESHSGLDAGSGTVTASGTGTESSSRATSASGTITASGSGAEAASAADARTATATASGAGSEALQYVDAGAGATTSSGSGTDSYSYADSESATVTVGGTGAEAYSFADSQTSTTTASGTASESYAALDAANGVITVTGYGVEGAVIFYVDSASGTSTVSGTSEESYLASGQTRMLALVI